MTESQYSYFLNLLFGKMPQEHFILLWTLHNKGSAWFKSLKQASNYIKDNQTNIYIGAGTSPKNFGNHRRCPANQIAALPALYADIDVKSAVHKKSNLPETIDEALGLVMDDVAPPSIVVHTGNGIQAWWIFDEIVVFESNEERQQFADLEQRLVHWLKRKADPYGWDVDSTFDLSRVFRLPGTINSKSVDKDTMLENKTHILNESGVRYDPLKLEEFLPKVPEGAISLSLGKNNGKSTQTTSNAEIGAFLEAVNFDFDGALPPKDKFSLCIEHFHPKWTQSWNNKRKDLMDNSASSYDFSLSIMAATAGWTDQEILNLLIAHRRRHGHKLKVDNQQYYARTIISTRNLVNQKEAEGKKYEKIKKTLQKFETADDDERETTRQFVSGELGLDFMGGRKFVSEESRWTLFFRINDITHNIDFAKTEDLTSKRKFKVAVADKTHKYIALPKEEKKWGTIIEAIMESCEIVFVSELNTMKGRIRNWINRQINAKGCPELTKDVDDNRVPFKSKEGTWCIFEDGLASFANSQFGDILKSAPTIASVSNELSMLGFNKLRFDYYTGEDEERRRHQVRAWNIPNGFLKR